MRSETKTIYQYDELPTDMAKVKARDWWVQHLYTDTSDWRHVFEDAKTAGALIGIEIEDIGFSGFWSQGDGANFEGRYRYARGGLARIKDYAPQDTDLHNIADQLQRIQIEHSYSIGATCTHHGHYQHSGCMAVDVYNIEDEYRDIGDAEQGIRDLLRLFADWIYKQLQNDYDYQASEDNVVEAIRENQYEFYADGECV